VPIQISVYDDKLMIFNNGYLHTGWTINTLLEKHSSQPYNPDIANTFFRASLIEAWGRGIEKIQNACRNEDVPLPKISFDGSGFWLKFTFKESQIKMIPDKVSITVVKPVVKPGVKTNEKILLLLSENPVMSLAEVAHKLDRSVSAIEQATKRLRDKGRLERIGPKKGGYWKVIELTNETQNHRKHRSTLK